jgi:hypothetical protein
MTDDALASLNSDLSNKRDAIKAQQMLIKVEFDKRATAARVEKMLAKLSPDERAALKATL